uniref:Promethin n=1 Tax=Glossina austeni TaxID=7395 RepID=A0A1A9VD93_GLOAU
MDSSSSENIFVGDNQIRRPSRQKSKRKPEQFEQISQGSHNVSKFGDKPEVLLKILIETFRKLWLQTKRRIHIVMDDSGGYQIIDSTEQWCGRHPKISLCFLAAGLVTFLPFLLLILFGISTVAMTLVGFLVLEGTLLAILSMMMLGLLGTVLLILIFVVIVGTTAYFGFANICDLYGGIQNHKQPLKNFLKGERNAPAFDDVSNTSEKIITLSTQ